MSKAEYDRQTAKNRKAIEQKIATSRAIVRLIQTANQRRIK